MGKNDDIPEVKIWRDPEAQPGLHLRIGSPRVAAIGSALLLFSCATFCLWAQRFRGQPRPVERAAPALWPGFTILGWTLLTALCIGVLVGLTYVVVRLYLNLRHRRAEIARAEVDTTLIQPSANGLYPWRILGNTMVNLNAAPAGTIGPDGSMPDPRSHDARQAAQRASTIQALAASGGRGPAIAGPYRPAPGLPPILLEDQAPREVQLLLEAGRQQWGEPIEIEYEDEEMSG